MDKLIIKEVSPRDGLQTERPVTVEVKENFIRKLIDAGITNIEIGSLVNEKKVPQMSGTKELIVKLNDQIEKVNLFVLVFTPSGIEKIIDTSLKEISLFIGASETFNLKNINCTTLKAMDRACNINKLAKEYNMFVRGYIAMAFGCPYDGHVPREDVTRLIHYYQDLGINEIVLADTIGHATPEAIKGMLTEAKKTLDVQKIGMHLHNTLGNARQNTIAAIEEGVRVFDSAVGGLGGCPFTHNAIGNISTEEMIDIAGELGFETGIDPEKLEEAKNYIQEEIKV